MIDIITRSRDPKLYDRMTKSAEEKAYNLDEINFFVEHDKIQLPKLAESYNRMAKESKADILGFVQDDVEFISDDWDRIINDIFVEYKPDILSVVGSDKYEGGEWCRAGNPHMFGLVGCLKDGQTAVKIFSKKFRYHSVKVVDGFFMFMPREFVLQNPFDETFDELFYWDLDICLRAKRVGITCDVLIKHSKPPALYGVYPAAMKPREAYRDKFNEKHGFAEFPMGDQRVACWPFDQFMKDGQTRAYQQFARDFLCESVR
jgi:hypothetical protein